MKKRAVFLILFLLLGQYLSFACPECDRNQPDILKGITHGSGPTGTVDYIIIWSAIVIVSIALFFSIKYLVKPKETNPKHIKNIILDKYF